MFIFVHYNFVFMSENKDIEDLLKNIQAGLKKHSIKELNEAIITVLNKKEDKTIEIDYVLRIVANQFSISVKRLKEKNTRGVFNEAKHVAFCLLHYNLGLSLRHISDKIFSTWPSSVHAGVMRLKDRTTAIKSELKFFEVYDNLQTKLINFITEQKQ